MRVSGYAQVLQSDPDERGARRKAPLQLHIAEDLPTHKVVISNRYFEDKTLADFQKLSSITAGDSSYRIRHFVNDHLTSPDVEFYCTLS